MAGGQPDVAVVVLAAGDGRRMRSRMPKVLHRAAGRSLLAHVLAAQDGLDVRGPRLVVTSGAPEVEAAVDAAGLRAEVACAVQPRASGTADAVRVGLRAGGDRARHVLVVAGDTPLLQTSTLQALLDEHLTRGSSLTLLTAELDDPFGYGRVVRGDDGEVRAVVEELDADGAVRALREINAGVYVFETSRLQQALEQLRPDNTQGELLLTDAVAFLARSRPPVVALRAPAEEVAGVNSRAQLADVARVLRARAARRWMDEGVTIVDPSSTFIDVTARIEPDAEILPFTLLEGETVVRAGAHVGPQVRAIDSDIGEEASVSYAVLREARIGPGATVGPFASLRPGTVLEAGSKAGTFVETKATTLGEGTKAPHLSYLGDAHVGSRVNIGAGTITANWDGRAKHETVIEDDAYIGSDTMLVGPTRIGRRAATGAGAVVRGDVPDDALAVGMPARILPGKGDRMRRRARVEGSEPDGEAAAD